MIERSNVIQQVLDLFETPSYLEIGVDHGQTFHSLSATSKTAVDPNFKFSPPSNSDAVEYYAVNSDNYFSEHCAADKFFDVVYIDGLHIFEQTLRDLLNAAIRLRSNGVIIIDDILPVSYQSALPLIDEAFKVRDYLVRDHPSLKNDNTWMGDVYKIAFFVQTFMQQFSYATVQENHGQLILWQAVRPAEAVVHRSMLELGLLGFSDTVVRRSVFQIRPFHEIISDIRVFKDISRAAALLQPSTRPRQI